MHNSHEHWVGNLEMAFAFRDGVTRLVHLKHGGPLMVQKALYPEAKGVCHTVMLHPPAGIAGGDHLNVSVYLEQGAQAVVTTPGATRWYKFNGRLASQSVGIHLANGAHLDFLPCENIFFDEVHATTSLTIHQATGSSFIAWEMSQLGRVASGETWKDSNLSFDVNFNLNGRLVWVDRSALKSNSLSRHVASGLDGHRVFGTMWLSSPTLSRETTERLAHDMPWRAGLRAGVSHLDVGINHGLMVLRAISHEVEDLRHFFADMWLQCREIVSGLPAQPLRLWRT